MYRILYGLLMLLVCTTSGCISDEEPQGSSVKVGETLPVFSVVMNDGETVSTQSLKGKIAVIVFFNTNCQDCQKELPVIQRLWDFYDGITAVKIVPIAREEEADEILEYWNQHNLSLPFSPQKDREVYNLFAPSVIPRIYIANAKGVITAAYGDTDLPDFDTLISDITFALESK